MKFPTYVLLLSVAFVIGNASGRDDIVASHHRRLQRHLDEKMNRRQQRHQDKISTDTACYSSDQRIHATFSASDAIMQSWVGIYKDIGDGGADVTVDVYRKPIHSIWSCDRCDTPNEVTFDIATLKLESGSYVVQSHGIGHYGQTTFAQSDPFTIKPSGRHCDDNHLNNLRASTSKM